MKHVLTLAPLALITASSLASADDAGAAFQRAQTAWKAGRIHEACQAFEQSEKLAARLETELGLASCYEQDGKPVSAARVYKLGADKDTDDARRKASLAKATRLAARAAKLRFAINPAPQGLVVTVDGVEVPADQDAPVDTGPHEVVASAPGFEGHVTVPVDREKAIVDVIVRMQPKAEAPRPAPPAPAPAPVAQPRAVPAPAEAAALAPRAAVTTPPTRDDAPASHRKRNGYLIGGAGVALVATAGVLYALSSSKYDDEQALCPGSTCKNLADVDRAHSLIDDSRTYSGIAIGAGVVGIAAIAVGGYFVLTRDPNRDLESNHVTASVGNGGGTIGYAGRF